MLITLSRPPHATFAPHGEKPHVITHDERSGIAYFLFVDKASQTMSLPSWDALTRREESFAWSVGHQWIE